MSYSGQLTIVSNRLPVVLEEDGGEWRVGPGAGGLVQAMSPILRENGGCWVGWPGVTKEQGEGWRPGLAEVSRSEGYELRPVVLNQKDLEGFYEGFANSVVWPLFHGFADRCQFDPAFYEAYGRVNQRFADVVVDEVEEGGFLWVHDYHLIELARRIRAGGKSMRLAFFLHIPFPSVENFAKLPWREELLADLLLYDLVGFQTGRDLHNFRRCVEVLEVGELEEDTGQEVRFRFGGRRAVARAFPIGMDFDDFERRAKSPKVSKEVAKLKAGFGPYKLLLGIDRLDYSKGLIHRLEAYEQALEEHPELHEKVLLFQLVVPSRENVPEYKALKGEFDQAVGRINGRFSTASWRPIHYLYNRVDPVELSALYRLASVALVTPLRDGMNLVCKEYCASQIDESGVLILSEFAGASEQLKDGAILVNPYDLEETARAILQAIRMPLKERKRRMRAMREVIKTQDVFWWARSFLARVQDEPAPEIVEVRTETVGDEARGAGALSGQLP